MEKQVEYNSYSNREHQVLDAGPASFGVGSVIFIVLLILKLFGEISLSWIWVVTSFLWGPLVIFFAGLGILLAIAIVVGILVLPFIIVALLMGE
jgi:hypothetical protein